MRSPKALLSLTLQTFTVPLSVKSWSERCANHMEHEIIQPCFWNSFSSVHNFCNLQAIKGIREKVQLATKFGVWRDKDRKPHVQGDPAYVRAACEASLKRLDVYCIDLYYQHRVDTTVPIEVTVGEMKKLVEEGKVKYIGLSDASAETIRRAHAVHPVTAVQIEWSLWNRQVEEEIVPTCRELGIGIVAYSPLGRGFLAAGPKIVETLADNDIRKNMSRFQVENMEKNKAAFESLCRVATRKGCTPAQLALAWVHSRGNDVAAIPGTSNVKNLEKNIEALSLRLTDDDINEVERAMSSADAGDKPSEIGVFNAWKIGHTPPLSSWNAA
eukprot:TRINITY_DN1456_c0_g1_i1.p1 TRINITY_DN1456_c0_g1~~TRINITY_DN1456_c0_g1_i1.p1  ORF type:complete len:328 (-),score=59.57 TRINITY_DN1456_c0_g1_i1:178-1161(-)